MAGFVKRSPSLQKMISSGIPTLDTMVHLAPGTISCIFEDENSFIHNTLLQIFVSSTLCTDRKIHVLARERKNLVSFRRHEGDPRSREDNLTIAWRYKGAASREPEFQFNLMEREELSSETCIGSIRALLELMRTTRNANFAVFSLFSPLLSNSPSGASEKHSKALALFEMRKYCRLNNHCMLLSIPEFFVEEEVSQYFDNILRIRSMLTLLHEKSNYHCLVEIQKLMTIGCLRINELESYKYGLILRPRRLAIERIDIPPEETESCGQSF